MKRNRRAGFTLIELLIAVAIIGILAAIAIPAYSEQVRKTRRGQAKADMTEVVQMLERCFTNRNSYLECFPLNSLPAPLNRSPRTGADVFYNLSLRDVTASDYVVRAEPTGDQNRDLCGWLELRQNGVRSSASGRDDCW